ncbi:tyrosine-type recombinase/integrase [Pedosphaera parvula]|uniref:Integrase domain protein SAM domain protein n=1 Tax=Pedosphaera parvula (strain Ellin514) TaxID=320771 RepID=B9X9W3_PEDPL|nr:site-specific integrase [Pedosphaera parvula]EEF63304.1 integrase domain protein SAM domain protein [Pedosphaera parvula Ellin514]
MKNPDFPVVIKKGNSVVKIYRHRNGEYDEFKVGYYSQGRRKLETFGSYDKATKRAHQINDSVNNGNLESLTLTGPERLAFTRAVNALEPFGLSLDSAVMEFVEALRARDGVPVSMPEAVRYYVKRHPSKLQVKTVAEAVDDFIKAKTDARRSERHVQDLSHRLGKFKDAFHCNLTMVTEPEIQLFLGKMDLAPRSRNNFRATIVSFFKWAKRKKYLPLDWDEVSGIEVIEDGEGEIKIFTPEELVAILTHADEKLIPFLVIGAFAGLRSSEICRLDWQQIGVGDGKYIEVKAKDARKTKQRRLVPIPENLRLWLKPYSKSTGKIWPYLHTYLYELLEVALVDAKVKWKKNGLRHSFISYRVAEAQDVAKVALEAGNSPQMIFSNYRELVTPEKAGKWFAITSDSVKEAGSMTLAE